MEMIFISPFVWPKMSLPLMMFAELHTFSQLNFVAEYVPARPGEKWGGKTKNGTWNGMVGMLVRDEIDFSAIGCGINQQGANSNQSIYESQCMIETCN